MKLEGIKVNTIIVLQGILNHRIDKKKAAAIIVKLNDKDELIHLHVDNL